MDNKLQSINYKINNLNLIRLFAATQVIISHLNPHPEWFVYFNIFNGVPIFFTLSGFLIYWSYENNPQWKTYLTNRFLRLYPALICSFIITVILLLYFGYLNIDKLKSSSFILWTFTQLTFLQEFTPGILHGFGGESKPNAALWTISIEILLYISIPIIYYFIKNRNKRIKTIVFILLGAISYVQNQTGFISSFFQSFSSNDYYLIFIHPFLQLFSFFFYFCFGIIIYLHKEKIIPLIANKGLYLLIGYTILGVCCYFFGYKPGYYNPNLLELFVHAILVLCIFSIAYTKPHLTEKFIGKTDISYGVYIYHYLILNTFYEIGIKNSWTYAVPITIICYITGWLSWILIEKKALKLKKKSLYKI